MYMIPWAHVSPQPKRHLDRFSRFCRVYKCVTDQQTDHDIRSITKAASTYVVLRCGLIITKEAVRGVFVCVCTVCILSSLKHPFSQVMPLTVYIVHRVDLLGHDAGQVTAHAQSTCRTTEHVPASWRIWGG